MGLFDLFSNDTAEKARDEANAGLRAGYSAAAPQYAAGTAAATNLTNQGIAGATTAVNGGVAGATAAANAGLAGATDAANGGIGAVRDYNAAALVPLQTTFDSATKGANAYGDATGANGVDGLKSASDTFHNSGQYGNYGFSLDQGLQALQRTRAAGGSLASGGADADTMNYATGLANKTYDSYVANLQPYLGQQTTAANGIASTNTAAGGQTAGLYNSLIGANTTAGSTIANANLSGGNALGAINGSLYGNLAGIANTNYGKTGDAANAMETGVGNNNAGAEMNNYKVGANQLNALLGVGKLAAGLF